VMSLDTRRKVAMLRWFGKIQRMSETRLVKKMFNEVNYVWVVNNPLLNKKDRKNRQHVKEIKIIII